jgi:hypothetical protein
MLTHDLVFPQIFLTSRYKTTENLHVPWHQFPRSTRGNRRQAECCEYPAFLLYGPSLRETNSPVSRWNHPHVLSVNNFGKAQSDCRGTSYILSFLTTVNLLTFFYLPVCKPNMRPRPTSQEFLTRPTEAPFEKYPFVRRIKNQLMFSPLPDAALVFEKLLNSSDEVCQ